MPSGTKTSHSSPARAQYAANAVPALPLLSATTRRGASRRASSASITAPRSLNDSVGIRKSSLACTRSASGTSGVFPSASVTANAPVRGSAEP